MNKDWNDGFKSGQKEVLEITKQELQESCKGTQANCYNIYQAIKSKLSYKTGSGGKGK